MIIQLKRGLKANLPASDLAGVPLITLDTNELFIGQGAGNPLSKISDIVIAATSTNIDTSKIWINTTTNEVMRYNGSAWIQLDVASFSSITGSPTDNTALAAILNTFATTTWVTSQLASLGSAVFWQTPAISILSTPPVSPNIGDCYLIGTNPTGVWSTEVNAIATYSATGWIFKTPVIGMVIEVENENNFLYLYNGTAWIAKAFDNITASTGLVRNGNDIQLNSNVAGAGLTFTSGVLAVGTIDCGTF